MPRFCQISLCWLLLLIPVSVVAMSRQYDADAVVTMRNGNPCFSYPPNEEKLFGYHLSVSKIGQHNAVEWDIQKFNYDKTNMPEPNSPEHCIEYGVVNYELEVKRVAEPLLPDTPYRVFISVAEAPTDQRYRYLRKFAADFCISSNKQGEPIVVNASGGGTGDWRCLKPGESPKRGFWQRLFGK
jgi:hypothetical protein